MKDRLKDISDQVLRILEGHPPHAAFDPEGLHRMLLDYWDRTGLADKIFSTYSRAQVRAATIDVWSGQFIFLAGRWADDEASFPARQQEAERLDRLDVAIDSRNKDRQAQADKDYARYQTIADQILRENPDLVADRGPDGIRLAVSLTKLAEKVHERLKYSPRPPDLDRLDWPPSTKTILRALKWSWGW